MQTKINLKSADHHNYDSSADFIYQYTILLCAYLIFLDMEALITLKNRGLTRIYNGEKEEE